MTDRPKRPILSLKRPVAAPVPPPPTRWKCKPCGAVVTVEHDAEGDIRCPSCNARIGRAETMRAKDPEPGTVRARRLD